MTLTRDMILTLFVPANIGILCFQRRAKALNFWIVRLSERSKEITWVGFWMERKE